MVSSLACMTSPGWHQVPCMPECAASLQLASLQYHHSNGPVQSLSLAVICNLRFLPTGELHILEPRQNTASPRPNTLDMLQSLPNVGKESLFSRILPMVFLSVCGPKNSNRLAKSALNDSESNWIKRYMVYVMTLHNLL